MTEKQSTSGRVWRYRFSQPDETEIEIRELDGDDSAMSYGGELSKTRQTAVKISRHNSVDWEYLTEVDERR